MRRAFLSVTALQAVAGAWMLATARPWNAIALAFGALVTAWPAIAPPDEDATIWSAVHAGFWLFLLAIAVWPPGGTVPDGLLAAVVGMLEGFTVAHVGYAAAREPGLLPVRGRRALVVGIVGLWAVCLAVTVVNGWIPEDLSP